MFKVEANGIPEFERQLLVDEKAARQAASITVNAAARLAKREGARRIKQQVALGPGYINQNMFIRFAKRGETSASVWGRFRPTSLARFATNRSAKHGKPIRLRVKPGKPARVNRRMFLFKKLRSDNIGAAIRLKPDERLRNRKKAIRLSEDDNLYLIYAPSVDQVFRSVRGDMNPQILRFMDNEFQRQFTRLAR